MGWTLGKVGWGSLVVPCDTVVAAVGDPTSAIGTKPAGTVAGDLMIAQVAISSNYVDPPNPGWTLIISATAGTSGRSYLAYRVSTGSGESWGSFTSGSNVAVGVMITTIRGIDSADPIVAVDSNEYNVAEADIYMPAVTLSADAYIFGYHHHAIPTGFNPSGPTGFQEVYYQGNINRALKSVNEPDCVFALSGTTVGPFFWYHAFSFTGVRTVQTVALRLAGAPVQSVGEVGVTNFFGNPGGLTWGLGVTVFSEDDLGLTFSGGPEDPAYVTGFSLGQLYLAELFVSGADGLLLQLRASDGTTVLASSPSGAGDSVVWDFTPTEVDTRLFLWAGTLTDGFLSLGNLTITAV